MNDFDAQGDEPSDFDPRKFNPADFQAFMKKYLDDPESFDAQELAKAAGIPTNPEQLKQLLEMISGAMSQQATTEGVDWDQALAHAKNAARRNNFAVTDEQRTKWRDAVNIANLWLGQATQISDLTTEPKLLTRDLWVDDAMPLFKAMSQPVADRMSIALSEHVANNAPEELTGCEIVAVVPVKVTFPGALRSFPIVIVPPVETNDR